MEILLFGGSQVKAIKVHGDIIYKRRIDEGVYCIHTLLHMQAIVHRDRKGRHFHLK